MAVELGIRGDDPRHYWLWYPTLVAAWAAVGIHMSSVTPFVLVSRIKDLHGDPSGVHLTNSFDLHVVDNPRSGRRRVLDYSGGSFMDRHICI
jgi:hypothetical protein